MTMKRWFIFSGLLFAAVAAVVSSPFFAAETPAVHVASMDSVGPRPLEQQTRTAIVRDYLEAWQSMSNALADNRPALLDDSFVGLAKEKLADTIRAQSASKIQSSYHELSHDLRILFYSTECLSIQLADDVEYDVEVRHDGQSFGTQHIKTRYLAVLTPTESRWKVRILQAGSS